jgi:hypothetical protein
MRYAWVAVALMAAGCSNSNNTADRKTPASGTAASVGAPKITQFYATTPNLPRGEKGMVCYGVENAKTVWLSPPRQELSAALSRCVEVTPAETTTYKLTAEGEGGAPATQELTVTVGAARAKIVDVTISSLSVKRGDVVSVCFHARNAATVRLEPTAFRYPKPNEGCTFDHPQKTTTYVLTATGPGGDQDHEHVTVTVK